MEGGAALQRRSSVTAGSSSQDCSRTGGSPCRPGTSRDRARPSGSAPSTPRKRRAPSMNRSSLREGRRCAGRFPARPPPRRGSCHRRRPRRRPPGSRRRTGKGRSGRVPSRRTRRDERGPRGRPGPGDSRWQIPHPVGVHPGGGSGNGWSPLDGSRGERCRGPGAPPCSPGASRRLPGWRPAPRPGRPAGAGNAGRRRVRTHGRDRSPAFAGPRSRRPISAPFRNPCHPPVADRSAGSRCGLESGGPRSTFNLPH